MVSYCISCDEFFDYRLLQDKKNCPTCGDGLYYFRTKAHARRLAPVKARCMHCVYLDGEGCPEDTNLIDPLYHKACESFVPKKGADYRK